MMSAPAVNSAPVLPPAPAPSLPLPVKINPPSPPASKPPVTQNHNSSVPLSLVHENKSKPQDKPKEPSPATSNGIENPPITASAPIPPPKVSIPLPPAEEAPAVPVPVAPVLVNNADKEPPAAAPKAPADPEPAVSLKVAEVEPAPPKPAKPKGAKRRRDPIAAETPHVEEAGPEKKPRRARAPVHHYQSPLPEITTVINRSLKIKDNNPKSPQLVIFYKNEFLAVRNAEGGFFLCQTTQNIFRTSHKIHIRWLSMDEKEKIEDGAIFTRDFYDVTDFECILTNVALKREGKNKYKLPNSERDRVENILKRGLDVEKGVSEKPSVTEDHPDGIDISLYRDEAQLQKPKASVKKRKKSPVKISSPKKVKKSPEKPKRSKLDAKKSKTKAKSKKIEPKKVPVTIERGKSSRAERSIARTAIAEKEVLKVSPPNEKARVVAKILRKNIDSSPGINETSEKSKSGSKSTKKVSKLEKVAKKKLDKKKTKSSDATVVSEAATPTANKKANKADRKEAPRSVVFKRKGKK